MKKFEKPFLEKVEFESNDVITTSSCSPYCPGYCKAQCLNVETCPNNCNGFSCPNNTCEPILFS